MNVYKKIAPLRTLRKKCYKGFTLVEILVAIFIFSVIIVTIMGSYRLLLSSTHALEESSAGDTSAQNCMERISTDLMGVYVTLPPAYRLPQIHTPPDPHRFVCRMEDVAGVVFPQLRFTSSAHIDFAKSGRKGIVEIVYYVAASQDNGFVLKRADRLYPYKEFTPHPGDAVLCEQVSALKFIFSGPKVNEPEVWDSESEPFGYATPRTVKIILETGQGTGNGRFETTLSLSSFRKPQKL